ncbi:MAG: hypothetical protein KDJ52_15550 [Anaerolineae bacterium]|nr:hypothetical protein [Anaerolineae bacterium]
MSNNKKSPRDGGLKAKSGGGSQQKNFALSLYFSPESNQRQTLRARLEQLDEVLQTCQSDDVWIDAYEEWLEVHEQLTGGSDENL